MGYSPWGRKESDTTERVHFITKLGGSGGKALAYNAGDPGLIPELGRSPEEGNDYTLQFSGLENSMDCIVHGVTKSQTRLNNFHLSVQVNLIAVCSLNSKPQWRKAASLVRLG